MAQTFYLGQRRQQYKTLLLDYFLKQKMIHFISVSSVHTPFRNELAKNNACIRR